MTLLSSLCLDYYHPTLVYALKNAFLHYFPSSYEIFDPITTGGKDTNCGINDAHIKGDHCSSMTINTGTFFQGNISQKKRLKWFF